MELIRLQQTFGISPHDALFVRPAWEIDLFLRALAAGEKDDDG